MGAHCGHGQLIYERCGDCLAAEFAAAREQGRREGLRIAEEQAAAHRADILRMESEADADMAAARRDGYAESLRWVEHYLAMELMVSARAVLEELRSRIAYEMEHGKSTSVLMEGNGSGCCANERKVGRNEGLALGVEAGHRNGYADCQRDVAEELRRKAQMWKAVGEESVAQALSSLAFGIEGAHAGAAKKEET